MNFDKINQKLEETMCFSANEDKIGKVSAELLQYLGQKKIIIYPAGALGQLLEKTLASYNISIFSFIDRESPNLVKIGETPVYAPNYLEKLDESYIVLIATNWKSQFETLSNISKQHNSNLAVINGFSVNRVFRYNICSAQLKNQQPYDLIQCENCGFERRECSLCLTYLKKVGHVADQNVWRSKTFDWFGYILGQACTLKCVHCCESIPYLKDHKFVPCETIVADISKIAASCQFLKFVELIGGEPFLHPEFENILNSLLKIKNIGYIKMFTNATVIPTDLLCDILKNPRIMLQVSNYEHQTSESLLKKITATKLKLKEKGIRYVFSPHLEWRDFSSFALHNTEEKVLKKVFKNCPILNCHRLYNGVLYRCPHQYAGIQLGKLEKYSIECIDIHRYTNKDLGKALEEFENIDYIDACRYCTLPYDAPVVPAGEQLK
ncbi:MAG: hypothetical protein A2099_08030 [Planctomycetes bacterium GWF2_39_10]|nr:MAG: hypothetical protein A2Y09_05230 [Planctomycetes bacterium GWA2_39_15]OHB46320.1 MAG: hypothetical protein A2099_08030 [Planctomycetes bacterium GWF2_39_10]